jgi:hypothetical protein
VAGVANEEREQTLNQLLTEMDGFNSDPRLPVVSTGTDALDSARNARVQRAGGPSGRKNSPRHDYLSPTEPLFAVRLSADCSCHRVTR